jgi:hypothetical protein
MANKPDLALFGILDVCGDGDFNIFQIICLIAESSLKAL